MCERDGAWGRGLELSCNVINNGVPETAGRMRKVQDKSRRNEARGRWGLLGLGG